MLGFKDGTCLVLKIRKSLQCVFSKTHYEHFAIEAHGTKGSALIFNLQFSQTSLKVTDAQVYKNINGQFLGKAVLHIPDEKYYPGFLVQCSEMVKVV